MSFSKKKWFSRNRQNKDFYGGCNWKSKTSQNVQKLVLIKKINVFSEKKFVFFIEKSLNVANLLSNATEPWTIKISQNDQKMGVFL